MKRLRQLSVFVLAISSWLFCTAEESVTIMMRQMPISTTITNIALGNKTNVNQNKTNKSEEDVVREQSNPDLDFGAFLNGVKYALIELEPDDQVQVDKKGSILLDNVKQYLISLGMKQVAISSEQKAALYSKVLSYCDIVRVKVNLEMIESSYFSNHKLIFNSCKNDEFRFFSNEKIENNPESLTELSKLWTVMYGTPNSYDKTARLQLQKNLTQWTTKALQTHFDRNTTNRLEGIFEKMILKSGDKTSTIGILKDQQGDNFTGIYLSGAPNKEDWQEGEAIAVIEPTGTQNLYKVNWKNPDKTGVVPIYLSIDEKNMLYFSYNDSDNIHRYFKLYPKTPEATATTSATGTGVALSADGYVVTNNHVVEGGNRFEIEIIRNGIPRSYKAILTAKDPINDLAILKIDDFSFEGIPEPLYTFRTRVSDVGEQVFTLGYPLTSTMGREIKLTTGVISSQTGYQGDVSNYQITVPVNPGNSGGPLFDSEGNLVGIIKARHSKAVGVTYAIKSRNVLNLVELLPKHLKLPTSNVLSDRKLTEQVKALRSYVFFIKVYNH
ncbi:MAG: S1C family serine protease [Chitinophagales bacterium]